MKFCVCFVCTCMRLICSCCFVCMRLSDMLLCVSYYCLMRYFVYDVVWCVALCVVFVWRVALCITIIQCVTLCVMSDSFLCVWYVALYLTWWDSGQRWLGFFLRCCWWNDGQWYGLNLICVSGDMLVTKLELRLGLLEVLTHDEMTQWPRGEWYTATCNKI